MNLIEKLKIRINKTKKLFENNQAAIKRHNASFVPKTLIIAASIMIVPIIFSFFRESMKENIPAYIITLVIVIMLYFLYKIPKLNKYPLLFIYLLFKFISI